MIAVLIFLLLSTTCIAADVYVLYAIQKVYTNRQHFYVIIGDDATDPQHYPFERFMFFGYMTVWMLIVSFDMAFIIFSCLRLFDDATSFLIDGILLCVLGVSLIYWWVRKDFLRPLKKAQHQADLLKQYYPHP